MCIWVHKTKARKSLGDKITIGTAVLDVLTGYISSSQFQREFYHTPCTYDELERIVSIYNPSECIVISNLSRKMIDEIAAFSCIMSKKYMLFPNYMRMLMSRLQKKLPNFQLK